MVFSGMMKGKKRKIFLLGGEGFLGRNISREISAESDCYSIGIEKSIFPERADKFLKVNPYREKINDKADVFVHLIDNRIEEENFLGEEQNLLENINLDNKPHLIVFSSVAARANPDSPYGRRKKMLEEFYREYCDSKGIKLTVFRMFNTFGDYQMPYVQGSLVANIFFNHSLDQPVEINDWEARRDFIWARDAALAVRESIKKGIFGTIELGSGKLASVRELVEMIEEKVIGKKLKVKNNNRKEAVISPVADIEKLKNILPKLTPLEVAFKNTFRFYQKNIELIKKHLNL